MAPRPVEEFISVLKVKFATTFPKVDWPLPGTFAKWLAIAVTSSGLLWYTFSIGYYAGRKYASHTLQCRDPKSMPQSTGRKYNTTPGDRNDPQWTILFEKLHPTQRMLLKILNRYQPRVDTTCVAKMHFIGNLIKYSNCRKILDVNFRNSYSVLALALALPLDGFVVASTSFIQSDDLLLAIEFWEEAHVRHKVALNIMHPVDLMGSIFEKNQAGTFDFAYVMVDKESWEMLFEACLKLIRPSGFLALDHSWWNLDGKVANKKDESFQQYLQSLFSDRRIDVTALEEFGGLNLVYKKSTHLPLLLI